MLDGILAAALDQAATTAGVVDQFNGLPWPAITAAGGGWLLFGALAWYVVRAVVKGDFVPRKNYDDVLKAAATKDEHIKELTDQNSLMLNAFGPTLTDFLRGLRRAAGITSTDFRDGGDDG